MSGFVYRLAPLLERKEAALEDAQRNLARRMAELSAASERLESLEIQAQLASDRHARARRDWLTASGAAITGADVQRRATDIEWLARLCNSAKDDVLEQKIEVQDCEDRLDDARTRLETALREAEVMRKHRKRSLERFNREADRRAETEADEAGTVLFNRRRSG